MPNVHPLDHTSASHQPTISLAKSLALFEAVIAQLPVEEIKKERKERYTTFLFV